MVWVILLVVVATAVAWWGVYGDGGDESGQSLVEAAILLPVLLLLLLGLAELSLALAEWITFTGVVNECSRTGEYFPGELEVDLYRFEATAAGDIDVWRMTPASPLWGDTGDARQRACIVPNVPTSGCVGYHQHRALLVDWPLMMTDAGCYRG